MYSICQKECNKRAVVALISAAYRAPHFDAFPESAPSCKVPQSFLRRELWRFSRENVARFAELRHVSKNRGTLGKKCRNAFSAQIQRQTIKVQYISIKNGAPILISVAFFLAYTV